MPQDESPGALGTLVTRIEVCLPEGFLSCYTFDRIRRSRAKRLTSYLRTLLFRT